MDCIQAFTWVDVFKDFCAFYFVVTMYLLIVGYLCSNFGKAIKDDENQYAGN
jgi:hypothetical protein